MPCGLPKIVAARRAVLDTSGHSTVRSWGLLLPVLT